MSTMDRADLRMYAKSMQHPVGYVAGQLELTSECEQRCVNCQSWIDHETGKERGEWELDDVKHLFRQLSQISSFEHLTLTGGDPATWKHTRELLEWHFLNKASLGFKLRINTALPHDLSDDELPFWRECLDDLRVSLDGVKPWAYKAMRGVNRNPEEVFDIMARIDHPRTTTLTCVSHHNISHVPEIVNRLMRASTHEGLRLRKAIFIPVRPQNDKQLVQISLGRHRTQEREWQDLWERLQSEYADLELTSFGEQVTREQQPMGCDCHVSAITFHIKHNGDLYPCCLMGGEALETRRQFRIGNVQDSPIDTLWFDHIQSLPQRVYDDPNSPCSRICLWKQTTMNRLAIEAADTTLAMP